MFEQIDAKPVPPDEETPDGNADQGIRAGGNQTSHHPNGYGLDVHALEESVWSHVSHSPIASMWNLQGISLKELGLRTWKGVDEDNLFGRASQLAYSFFSAIFPGLIAMSSIMGLIAQSSSQLSLEILGRIGHLIPPSAWQLVMQTFQQTTSASSAGKVSVGLAVALFSASVGVSAIQDTLNTVYKVRESRPFWKARLQAIAITVLVAAIVIVGLLMLIGGDFGASYLEHRFYGSYTLSVATRITGWIAGSLLMMMSFEVLYYFCPDVQRRKWRGFTPGGLIGLAGWVVGSIGLRIYLHYFNSYSVTYGSLGAVIILLLSFYVLGVMILLGGEVNSQIEHAVAEHALKSGAGAPNSGVTAPAAAKL